jgi:SAM-dependent methyltransferase
MKGYRTIRGAYHAVTTEGLRDLLYAYTPLPLKRLKKRVVAEFEKDAAHDDIYDAKYYAKFVEPTMQLSAKVMAASIVKELEPQCVIDLGCGTGALLNELRERGVDGKGFELAESAIEICRKRGLDVQRYDIEHDAIPEVRADLVISTEVAEHLPATCADRFVEALSKFADRIVLTAATPSQGGTDHVNEQPNAYWIEKLAERGFQFDQERSHRWREEWRAGEVAACFWSSVMIFSKSDADD